MAQECLLSCRASCTPNEVSTGQRVWPLPDSHTSVRAPVGCRTLVMAPPTVNSARHPRSTHTPRWLIPHDLPRMQALSLSWRVRATPPAMSTRQVCRVLLIDSHV